MWQDPAGRARHTCARWAQKRRPGAAGRLAPHTLGAAGSAVLQRAGHLMQLPACAPCFAEAVGPSQGGPSQGLRAKAGPSAPGAGEAALPERARAHGAAQCQDEHGRQEPQDRARGCGRRLCRQRRRHARYAPPRRPPPRRRPPGAARCGLPGAAASRGAAGLRPARIAGATRTRPASPCGGRAGSARCPLRLESSVPTRQLVVEGTEPGWHACMPATVLHSRSASRGAML